MAPPILTMLLAAAEGGQGTEYTIYLVTAIVGCTLLALQVVLLLFGLSHDTDVDAGHDADFGANGGDLDGADHGADGHGNAFFKILSMKALCAFTGLFGLTGLALHQEGVRMPIRLAVALAVGLASFALVIWLMRSLGKLTSSGTINLRNAVGRTGSVYLRVPGAGGGAGKVTVIVQSQSLEFAAITDGAEIPTGTQVMVSDVIGEDTLKVVPL